MIGWDNTEQPQSAVYQTRPWDAFERNRVDMALSLVTAPAGFVRSVRPPLRQVPLLPPRFGYDRTPIGVRDVLSAGRPYVAFPEDYSGSHGSFSGSSVGTSYNPLG